MPIVYPKKTPWKELSPEERRRHFEEVARGYTLERAMAEAARCLQCQDPVCERGCPVRVPIRDFIRRVLHGDIEGAYRLIRKTNRFPAITGRVCPQEQQCELVCWVCSQQDPVAIGRLERFVADWAREHGVADMEPPKVRRAQKVAVIGSGPAGLACAYDLAYLGYPVTMFEALHAVGGVLAYGIPEFRLPRDLVREMVEELEALGVEIRTNVVVGRTVTIDQLMNEHGYQAVFIGTGAGLPQFLGIPGEHLKGVYSANEFLTRINLMGAHRFPEWDTPIRVGKRVAVIGAGDTAMDAVRVALRAGAQEAYILYRRSEKEMGAREEEYHHALEEGVIFKWQTVPARFVGDDQGWLRAIECVRTELGEPDASGRRRPVVVPGSNFLLEVETAVVAIGTRPNSRALADTLGLEVDEHGRIVADPETGATTREGVFAGGDVVTGAATVIQAMGAGQRAAAAIHQYLQSKLNGDVPPPSLRA